MLTADHPDVPYIESRTIEGKPAYTAGRPDGSPIWVVIHDMEYPERDTAAEWTANYFATGAGGRSVSSHYCADANSVVQCVRLADVAWTVGNRPGNYRGINWELAGYASQTREEWLDDFGRAMLARAAVIMRRDMTRFAIPARLLSDAQVQAFEPGVTSHNQLRVVFGVTTHTDPGPGFPYDYLMLKLIQEDAVNLTDTVTLPAWPELDGQKTATVGGCLAYSLARATRANAQLVDLDAEVTALRAEVAEIKALVAQGGGGVASVVDLSDAALAAVEDRVDRQLDQAAHPDVD